jgi:hypothetical protein
MRSVPTINRSYPSQFTQWGSVLSSLYALVGSLLVTMQSQRMNPPQTFDVIQTRVDAFVR